MNRNDFEVEICANSFDSVIEAEKGGANRVELCDNLCEGGTTPSIGLIELIKGKTSIDTFILIRPRGGDFVYNDNETAIMIKDILASVKCGADGIVIGCLTRKQEIDYETCSRLIEAAKGLPVTFHRAFDVCRNPVDSLELLQKLGVSRILTSGQQNKATEGMELLKKLNDLALNKNIKIMAGSGIDENNITRIAMETNIRAFHASLGSMVQFPSIDTPVKFNCNPQLPEYNRKISDSTRIITLINKLKELPNA